MQGTNSQKKAAQTEGSLALSSPQLHLRMAHYLKPTYSAQKIAYNLWLYSMPAALSNSWLLIVNGNNCTGSVFGVY